MPNWCHTEYVFEGSKSEVLKLHQKLSQLLSCEYKSTVDNDFGNGWLGDVLINHGFDWKKVSCRGFIDDLYDVVTEENTTYFKLATSTAWGPLNDMWDIIIENHYPSIKYVYLAIEHGCSLYLNSDTEGKYYDERYLLDLVIPEDVFGEVIDVYEFYTSEEELLTDIEKFIGKGCKGINEARDYITEQAKKKYSDPYDFYVVIAEFDLVS